MRLCHFPPPLLSCLIFGPTYLQDYLDGYGKPGLKLRVRIEKYFSCFSNKTYVVGTQKNRLNETVLLSTQNIC